MAELLERLRQKVPTTPLLLFSAALLLLVFSIVLAVVVNRPKEGQAQQPPDETLILSPVPPEPEQPAQLVTAEQVARLTYEDSVLGPLSWQMSEKGLEELNQTLMRYNIVTGEEICHFLAQATVETGAGRYLTESGDEAYFRSLGYTMGTRGAGYLHLTHEYGQMAFATWMMKRYVPALENIRYFSPANFGEEDITAAYYAALQSAANLGLNVSRYSRIVYDPIPVLVKGQTYTGRPVDMGNPHLVVYWDGLDGLPMSSLGPKFEVCPRFPNRVNTEFVRVDGRGELTMRVWERGSGETLASVPPGRRTAT